MEVDLARSYLQDLEVRFRKLKGLGDGALAQVNGADLDRALVPGQNSIAVLVKHLCGNMRSRWTGFLTSDGEKPDRDRDAEFDLSGNEPRATILDWWEEGWRIVFGELSTLKPVDLQRTVTIRGEPHAVLEALQRQLTHAAYHVGQIVHLARCHAGESWRSLSIPRGGSEEFDREMRRRFERDA